ncbi:MAG TPA: BamA/TamA family outer membrane protein, partial [Gemmatimonadales bacterium]
SNIYRVTLADSALSQITNVYTGVSGIIALSPALSVASQSGRIAFNVFEKGEFHLFTADSATANAGTPVKLPLAAVSPAMLPPVDRVNGPVANYMADDTTGLPKDTAFVTKPYSSSLSLDYVARPELGLSAGSFGVGVFGGTALYWSDMLGEHNLSTALSINGTLKDIGGGVGYQNTRRRLNWGVVAEQVPYQFASYSQGVAQDPDNPPVQDIVLDIHRIRQYNRDLSAIFSYPFNRVERVDMSVGVMNIGFSEELERDYYNVFGEFLGSDRTSIPTTFTALNMATSRVALVYDNATYGATSPILGQRWRFEADPTVGSLNFVALGADYRRYIVPVRPFTLAGRVSHFGRYGADAESDRLPPTFLGYQELIRGYDYNAILDNNECVATPTDGCPVLSQLFGSKIFVANAELRFPLLGLLGVGDGFYGFFPIELGVFADAGLAWNDSNRPQILSFLDSTTPATRSNWVTSAGGLMRINLFGWAVAEMDLVHPFQRPDQNWVWQFGIIPGF